MTATLAKPVSSTPGQILEQAGFFSSLTPTQRECVAGIGQMAEFSSDGIIYRIGDKAQHCFVLVSGVVRFNLALGNRTAQAGEIIRSGELFGWAALVKGAQRRIASASCTTSCIVLAIDGDRLIEMMDRDHSLGYAVVSKLNLLITSTITALAAG